MTSEVHGVLRHSFNLGWTEKCYQVMLTCMDMEVCEMTWSCQYKVKVKICQPYYSLCAMVFHTTASWACRKWPWSAYLYCSSEGHKVDSFVESRSSLIKIFIIIWCLEMLENLIKHSKELQTSHNILQGCKLKSKVLRWIFKKLKTC